MRLNFNPVMPIQLPPLRSVFGPRRTTPTQRRAVLRLIAVAAEEGLPLEPLLGAWSADERGGQVRRLRRLTACLREGLALPDALERVPGVLGDEATLLVRYAVQSGSLAPALRQRLGQEDEPSALLSGNLQRVGNYVAMMLVVGLPVLLFLGTFVLPNFRQISEEFSLDLPPSAEAASALFHLSGWLWWLAGLLVFFLVWTRLFAWPGRYLRRVVAPWAIAPLRSRRIASVLDRLGESVRTGRPLPGAISTLARYHYDPTLRRNLLFVRNELELGAELWPSLESSGTITRSENVALSAADRLGVSGWTLGALAASRRVRATRRMTLLSSLLVPLVVFAFGAFVLTQSLGVLSALVNMISMIA